MIRKTPPARTVPLSLCGWGGATSIAAARGRARPFPGTWPAPFLREATQGPWALRPPAPGLVPAWGSLPSVGPWARPANGSPASRGWEGDAGSQGLWSGPRGALGGVGRRRSLSPTPSPSLRSAQNIRYRLESCDPCPPPPAARSLTHTSILTHGGAHRICDTLRAMVLYREPGHPQL